MAVAEQPPIVGRDEQIQQLLDAVRHARDGHGSTIFIGGELGTGKQALIDEIERRVAADEELADCHFAKSTCTREGGGDNAYGPFAELLVDLLAEGRGEKGRNAVIAAVKEVAPDWLNMIPVAGAALSAGVKTAFKAQEIFAAESEDERARRAQVRHLQFIAALDHRLKQSPVVVLEICQAQWIDPASAGLLDRVARLIPQKAAVILVTYRPADLGEDHPLRSVGRDLSIDQLATRIELAGLDAHAVDELERAVTGVGLAPEVAGWLVSYTSGNPLFITALLPALVERGVLVESGGEYHFHEGAVLDDGELQLVGELEGIEIPGRISEILDEQIERLDEGLRNLLKIAAVEGARFLTATLTRVAKEDDAALLTQLDEAEKRHRIVRFLEALQRSLIRYEFAHPLLHQRVYAQLGPGLRISYHAQVADALVETWGEDAPRPVLLDIARHYEAGLDLPAAARFLVRAAQSAQVDGASTEAASLAERGLGLLDEAARGPNPADSCACRAELVAVLIGSQWENYHSGKADLVALIKDGEAAAERANDPGLRARMLHAEALYVLGTSNAEKAIAVLQQARDLARGAGDAVSELAITIDLGNTLNVNDLASGLKELRAALEVYDEKLAAQAATVRDLPRLRARLVGFIGVGELDSGELGQARAHLDESVAALDAINRRADLPRILNYRAQVALASGDFEAAEADARRALEAGGDPLSPWGTYNRSLIGKIQLDAEHFEAAGNTLRKAWTDSQQQPQIRLGSAVRQYLIEYLLRPESASAELDEAAQLLATLCADVEEGGFTDMLTAARSLEGELALRQGRTEDACKSSGAAVALLEKHGDMPIVRTEEILWRHSRCLAAAGDPAADEFRAKAVAVLERKADSLGSEEAKQRMLSSTPIARALGL